MPLDYAAAPPGAEPRGWCKRIEEGVFIVGGYVIVHIVALIACINFANKWEYEFSTREWVVNRLLEALMFPLSSIVLSSFSAPTSSASGRAVVLLTFFIFNPILWGVVWYIVGRLVIRIIADRRASR